MKNRFILFGLVLSLLYPVAVSALSANVYASTAGGSADNPSNATGAPDNAYATLWYPPSGGSFELSVSGFTPPESGKRELSSVIIYMEYKKIGWIGDDQMTLKYSIGSKQGATSITFIPSSREGMETLLSMDISSDRTFSMDDLTSLKITASTHTVSDPDVGQVDVDSIWVAIEAPEPAEAPSGSSSSSTVTPSNSSATSTSGPATSSTSNPSSTTSNSPTTSSTNTPALTSSSTSTTSSSGPEFSTQPAPAETTSPNSQPEAQRFHGTSFAVGATAAFALAFLIFFLLVKKSKREVK